MPKPVKASAIADPINTTRAPPGFISGFRLTTELLAYGKQEKRTGAKFFYYEPIITEYEEFNSKLLLPPFSQLATL
ncbi:hypothetical protein LBWT_20570 [Leptolyngbya boryana IAM M-101]|nr:hypothetical protein LBWT_20570 [Leptolyngbya boryana IAM M-101]BAS62493.1 hypothetical protein LBDG_20570 [Leptolyngbya boryana dg5]